MTEIMRNATQVVNLDIRKAIQSVERSHGLTQWQQLRLIRQVARGPGRVPPVEFYNLGLFRQSLSDAERLSFIAIESGAALNAKMNPESLQTQPKLMTDKFAMELVVRAAGHRSVETLGLLDTRIANGAAIGKVRVVHDLAEIVDFLTTCPLPLFGKPRYASRATGAFNLFERKDGGATGVMGNGRTFAIADLAAEILKYYPEGYLFQRMLANSTPLAAFSGTALGTLRVNTLQGREGAFVLYTCWRVPGREALADNFFYKGSAHCFVDWRSGEVIRAQMGNMTDGGEVTVHEASGLPLKGYRIPGFQAGIDMAVELHNLFPEHGVVGWDVALTDDGPVVVEANSSPIHGTYQITADRGLLNPEFKPLIDATIALQSERAERLASERKDGGSRHLRNMLQGMGLLPRR